MSNEKIKIQVPASTANLGPGFDSLSLALNLYNEFVFSLTNDGVKISQGKSNSLPEDSTNLVYKAFTEVYSHLKKTPPGIELSINCNIPLSAGLGSSASAVIGGILAANYFLNKPLSKMELLSIATKLEGHPDNCSSALLGGLTISISQNNIVYASQFPWPNELLIIAVTPDFELPTKISRELLPAVLSYGDATFNISRTAYLLSCLHNKDFEGLKIGFQDRLHQPHRKDLIPGMEEVFSTALKNGAYGATLSGAGPTLTAFATGKENAEKIGKAMTLKWNEFNIKSSYRVLNADLSGARVEILTKALS